ncbi:MAG: HAD hydrolase-like protein [Dysgonamonadaceae bacterium]|jgi:beta-phosphoglucomutase-like phosphatase (HAD superfamily)|nr:HAD hydrolase-like protein [Dysgonamonadaceae bacterium]
MKKIFQEYLRRNNYFSFDLKAILFDMDGVLYDSMPAHAKSWLQTMEEFGIKNTTLEEYYLHEGRTGSSTISLIFNRELNREATPEEIQKIYERKTELFFQYNTENTIPDAREILEMTKSFGLLPVLVTGSGQPSLLNKLDNNFPNIFTPETMVTAFDVKIGKPHPEPFLMGLEKGGNLKPNQAIAIENAPLGTESAHKAGIFVIAVNTGPLPDKVLKDAGADVVLSSMTELREIFSEVIECVEEIRN